jgi:glycosyltransferase involved in cell wall biosynthesis
MKREGKLRVYYYTLIRKIALKISDVAITVSYHTKAELSGKYPFVYKKIKVIYHGIDQKVFKSLSEDDLKGSKVLKKILGTNKYLLSISDRNHHKNFTGLLKAYGILVNRYHINEYLVIIGRIKSLNEENLLKKIISEVKLENRVHLLDYIDQSELPNIYRKASAYVFPSKFETFGFTPLEAMSCGVPVACARCSAMPEICGSNVLYFDPDDEEDIALKVYQILNNKSLKEKIVTKGIEYAKSFSWKNAAEKYLKIIRSFEKDKN